MNEVQRQALSRREAEHLATGFTQVPNAVLWDPELSREAKLTWQALKSFDFRGEGCWPRLETLEQMLGAKERAVRNWIDELIDAGYVRKTRRHNRSNYYELAGVRGAFSKLGDEAAYRHDGAAAYRHGGAAEVDEVEEDETKSKGTDHPSAVADEVAEPGHRELDPHELALRMRSVEAMHDELLPVIDNLDDRSAVTYARVILGSEYLISKDAILDLAYGLVPSGWQVKPLASLCERITDGAHHSPPSTSEGFPMASVKDMHNWGIRTETCRLISQAHFDDLVRQDCRPRIGDILIAKDGSYLKHVIVVADDLDLVILSSIALLRPNGHLEPNLLAASLREPETRARLSGFVSGVAIPRIVLRARP